MAISTVDGTSKVNGNPYPTFWSQADTLQDWIDLIGEAKCCSMINQLVKERDSVKNARAKAESFEKAKTESMASLIASGRIQINADGSVEILAEDKKKK
jgi:hypothetical protein